MGEISRRAWLESTVGPLVCGIAGCGHVTEPVAETIPEAPTPAESTGPAVATVPTAPQIHTPPKYKLVACPKQASIAASINKHGWVCGTMLVPVKRGGKPNHHSHAALWHVDGKDCVDIDMKSSRGSWAYAVNDHGHVVGENSLEPELNKGGFLWPNRPGERPDGWRWDALMPDGFHDCHALSINEHGLIAAHASTKDGVTRGFLWKGNKFHELKPLADAQHSVAISVSPDGHVVGNSISHNLNRATIWTEPGQPLPLRLGSRFKDMNADSVAMSIAHDGWVAGSFWKLGKHERQACIWKTAESESIPVPFHQPVWTSEAVSVNRHGHVVGTYQTKTTDLKPKFVQGGFLYNGNEMYDLTESVSHTGGLVLRYPKFIDDRGWIVGAGTRGEAGPLEAFVIRPA